MGGSERNQGPLCPHCLRGGFLNDIDLDNHVRGSHADLAKTHFIPFPTNVNPPIEEAVDLFKCFVYSQLRSEGYMPIGIETYADNFRALIEHHISREPGFNASFWFLPPESPYFTPLDQPNLTTRKGYGTTYSAVKDWIRETETLRLSKATADVGTDNPNASPPFTAFTAGTPPPTCDNAPPGADAGSKTPLYQGDHDPKGSPPPFVGGGPQESEEDRLPSGDDESLLDIAELMEVMADGDSSSSSSIKGEEEEEG